MKITFQHYQLKFRHPFALATGSRNYTDTVILQIDYQGFTGYGEAALPPYLKETVRSVTDFFNKIDPEKLKQDDLDDILHYIDKLEPENNAAKAAVDIALHDVKGKLWGKSLREMYAIPLRSVYSSYTIGISTPELLKTKMVEAEDYPLIKLKLGSDSDKELVENFLELSDQAFYVDVNQGWKDKHTALEMIHWLNERGAQFVEQPLPVGLYEETAWLLERSPLPIIADESVQRLKDMGQLKGQFSGVNIKLMKSTGICEAVKMIDKAREMGLKIFIGCMAESSCAVTAAAYLASLADWADLDGPQLIVNDPFNGIMINKGKVSFPKGPGLGVEKRG